MRRGLPGKLQQKGRHVSSSSGGKVGGVFARHLREVCFVRLANANTSRRTPHHFVFLFLDCPLEVLLAGAHLAEQQGVLRERVLRLELQRGDGGVLLLDDAA